MNSTYLRGLGIQKEKSISKASVAILQLEKAISLFLNQEFICSLTLAGAADGILAGLVQDIGKRPSHEYSYYLLKAFRKVLDLDPEIVRKAKKEIFKSWNFGRNTLKHHDAGDNSDFVINESDEAFWMIRRALRNADALGFTINGKESFEKWVSDHQLL